MNRTDVNAHHLHSSENGTIMTETVDPTDAVAGLVERLRQDADMLKDGYQRNLTELWHGVVVKDAAKACAAAADLLRISGQGAECGGGGMGCAGPLSPINRRATRQGRQASYCCRNQIEGSGKGDRTLDFVVRRLARRQAASSR